LGTNELDSTQHSGAPSKHFAAMLHCAQYCTAKAATHNSLGLVAIRNINSRCFACVACRSSICMPLADVSSLLLLLLLLFLYGARDVSCPGPSVVVRGTFRIQMPLPWFQSPPVKLQFAKAMAHGTPDARHRQLRSGHRIGLAAQRPRGRDRKGTAQRTPLSDPDPAGEVRGRGPHLCTYGDAAPTGRRRRRRRPRPACIRSLHR
jgi:hypothetical protein